MFISIKAALTVLLCAFGISAAAETLTDPWANLAGGAGPYEIIVDGAGNVYTTNRNNSTVSKITAAGVVTQNWAVLTGGASPCGIALDAAGNLYTGNNGNGTISKITPAGVVTNVWYNTGSSSSGIFNLVFDASGDLYATLFNLGQTVKISPAGTLLATYTVSQQPFAIGCDLPTGTVYVAHQNNGSPKLISKITSAGVVTNSWASVPAAGFVDLMVDGNGNVFTANLDNSTISKITPAGAVTDIWASFPGEGTARLTRDASDNIYATNNSSNRVVKISPSATVLQTFNLVSGASPIGIVYSTAGGMNTYIANNGTNTVSKIGMTPLPVMLISFTATAAGNGHQLSWRMGNESPDCVFDVTRSGDGKNFQSIGLVAAGTNGIYYYQDERALVGINYYRLAIRENDGGMTYSPIASVRTGQTGAVTVFPTIAREKVTLVNTNERLNGFTTTIYDNRGAVMATIRLSARTEILVKNWPAGMYTMALPTGEAIRICKQ